jgi:hypothetical protein
MSDEVNQSQDRIWFVRKGGKIFGPLASVRIRHYVNEGRVEMTDEASRDKKNWRTIRSEPELIPLHLRKPDAIGQDDELKDVASGKGNFWLTVIVVVLVLGGVIAAALFYQPAEDNQQPDCLAAPAAGINWNNCNKKGLQAENLKLDNLSGSNAFFDETAFSGTSLTHANFSYAHFERADLTYANLSGASLKGANLRNTDLGNAILDGADLRYADLTGAILGGASLRDAKLEGAVWFNGQACQKGSIGKCIQ